MTSPLLHVENAIAGAALLALSAIPLGEVLLRNLFGLGISSVATYIQNLTLWVGFTGAVIATRERRHLGISLDLLKLPGQAGSAIESIKAMLSIVVCGGLAWASAAFVSTEMEMAFTVGGWLPLWIAELVMPTAFALMGLRFLQRISRLQGFIALIFAVGAFLGAAHISTNVLQEATPWLLALLVLAGLLGTPIFVVLGGAALVLFGSAEIPIGGIAIEAYGLVGSPSIPSLALFMLAGYLLAEGGAKRRLIRLFRAFLGWAPGGMVVVSVISCAFFTTFTGATGMAILALGGLLFQMLVSNGYRSGFSIGLLTATGSIGLFFPPSLAVIILGVTAQISILDLFKAAVLPGLFMVFAVAVFAVVASLRMAIDRPRFDRRAACLSLWEAKWELMLPLIIVYGIFGGLGSLLETASIAVIYILGVELFIHRDLSLRKDLPRIFVKSEIMTGGIFVVLSVAMGLTNYLVDVDLPNRMADWVVSQTDSRFLFLIALNFLLLAVGCLMDIFSAIALMVPLLLPVAASYGISPIHFCMIFLVNLELGYLTPPVGMNLFLSSYRFERPMSKVFANTLPFFLLLLGVLLVITYVPWLSLAKFR